MIFAWLEEMLPQGMLTPRSQIWWIMFFALFPLAYIGGIALETVEESPAEMAGFEDRAASIRTAQEFAASKGFPVAGFHQYAVAETDDSLVAYYGQAKDPLLMAANEVVPGQQIEVLFRSPDQSHEFRTYLSLTGHVTGYEFGRSKAHLVDKIAGSIGAISINNDSKSNTDNKSADDGPSMHNAIAVSDMEAEAIARKAIEGNADLSKLIELATPRVDTDESDSARHNVIWEASPAGRPELTMHVTVGVRDSQVVGQHITATLDAKHRFKKPAYRTAAISLWSLFLTCGTFYAIFRYARRTLQKEVSHARTLIIAALFAISYSALAYSTIIDESASRLSGPMFAKIGITVYASSGVLFLIMGLLVGIGYGSGEGEVREAYPGKLTSLDALLAGRVFSRDVGASVLFGAAAAGWLLLLHHCASHFFKVDSIATRSDVLSVTFARLPWLALLVGRQYDSLLIAVSGLLLPASFFLRRGRRKAMRFIWLILFAMLAVLQDASKYPTFPAAVTAMVVLVCALLLPFFAFDLLAAMVSLSALSLVEELARLHAVFPSWISFATTLAALAFMGLTVAIYLAFRGKRVIEDDVRPVYAKNLAQRMSLQAEVQAAREAQLRLLPQDAPEMPGLQFAACCLPAHGVGGDFYDFYRLDANRVGIFVAQGSDQGLASALCIALAKGVLMHASLQPDSPTQTVIDLEASLANLLEGGNTARINFLYAVLDSRRKLLSYARLGDSPRFLIYREDAAAVPSTPLERVVQAPNRVNSAVPILEGSTKTNPGDFLIFFTKGVTFLRTKRFSRHPYQWLAALMPMLSRTEEPIQTSLETALAKHGSRASDDLTAVVIRVLQSEGRSQEVVA